MDPDIDWLCELTFFQPEGMAASQLRKEKDVVAQYEAIRSLSNTQTSTALSTLLTTCKDSSVFYRIRCEAAFAMAHHRNETLEMVGLETLKDFYKDQFCRKMKDDDMGFFPLRNDFSSLQAYYLQKAVIMSLGQTRDDHGVIPTSSRQIVLDALVYNDNTSNEFSDVYWVSTLIEILSDSFLPEFDSKRLEEVSKKKNLQNTQVEHFEFPSDAGVSTSVVKNTDLLREAFEELERFRNRDRLVPSYHNLITQAVLQAYLKWMAFGLMPVDLSLFLSFTRYFF
jgi:transcription initiation factor TFIID subunit 2